MSGSGPSGSLFVFADVGFGSHADISVGHRVGPLLALFGHSNCTDEMSAIGGKADIADFYEHVGNIDPVGETPATART
jgi:hypothetical protein